MDFGRIRRIAWAFTILAAACLICGLLLYFEDHMWAGVSLMIVGVSVGIISATYLRMLTLIYNPWLAENKKYKKRKSHHRCDPEGLSGAPGRAPMGFSTCSCRRAGAS